MLIHPWDASLDATEWQEWLARTDRFGMLAVNNIDPAQAPVLVPTHFTVAGEASCWSTWRDRTRCGHTWRPPPKSGSR